MMCAIVLFSLSFSPYLSDFVLVLDCNRYNWAGVFFSLLFFFIIQWAAKKLLGSRSLSIPFRSMYVHLVARWPPYFSALCPFTICVRSPWLS